MKALSIKQPWANMIASGRKTIETRTWYVNYRGPILIVSSKSPKIEPAGFALATADLVDCRPMTREDEAAACCEIYPRANSWVFQNIRKIDPFQVKGNRGLYEIEFPIKTAAVERLWLSCSNCMEEWYALSDEVGEKCSFCHEGIAEEGEPNFPTTSEGVFELAKQAFPVTSSFGIAGWMLPDGELLALTYGGGRRDRNHGEVSRLFEESLERWEAVNKFRDMGAIRMQPYGSKGGYIIEMSVMPSQEQLQQIRRLLGIANELQVEIFGSGRDGIFFQEYPYGTQMEEIYRDIKAVFAGGGRSKLMQFHNSNNWYKSASALPRGTFEPLKDIIERLSSSIDTKGGIDNALLEINELLAPLTNFRNITAEIQDKSVLLIDSENNEACLLSFVGVNSVVEHASVLLLGNMQKAASSILSQTKYGSK